MNSKRRTLWVTKEHIHAARLEALLLRFRVGAGSTSDAGREVILKIQNDCARY